MKLSKLLSPDRIIADLRAESHWEAIVELVDHLVKGNLLPAAAREETLSSLREREDQFSTGIGAGVAIPHTFSDQLEVVSAVFGRSEKGIDFQALDNEPVKLIVLFVVPRKDYGLHLQTLAAIAKIFTNSEVRRRLIEAPSAQDLLAILDHKSAGLEPSEA